MLGELIHWLFGNKGYVNTGDFFDEETSTRLVVRTSKYYTVLKVNNKTEFFFNRESGTYDGFGHMENFSK